MARTLGIGIIGAGAAADIHHLPGYEGVPDAETVAVADANLDRAEAMARKYSVPIVFQDYRELLRHEQIQAVSICTPNALHYEQALAALQAGKHVLCEVPVALRPSECRALDAAARERGLVFLPASYHRFHHCYQRARELLVEGSIGRPILLRARFGNDGPYASWSAVSDWYYDPEQSGGGALLDQGLHALDLFRYLIGEPHSLSADASTLGRDIPLEDTVLCVLRTEGARGQIEASWSSKESVATIEIHGTAGVLAVCDHALLRIYLSEAGWQAIPESDGGGAQAMLAHFVRCCLQGETPLVSGEDAARAVALALAAYESARSGRLVNL